MLDGVLLVSTDEVRRQSLFDALASFQRHQSGLPVHVITSIPLDVPFSWVRKYPGFGRHFYKTRMDRLSPFDRTLFVSEDTRFESPVADIGSILNDCDLAMIRDRRFSTLGEFAQHVDLERWMTQEEKDVMRQVSRGNERAPYFDSAVMFFKKTEALSRVFSIWHEEWLRFQGEDQPALARALLRSPARVRILPEGFNVAACDPGLMSLASEAPKIVHIQGLEARGASSSLAPPHVASEAFRQTAEAGLCTREQYEAVGRLVTAMRPLNLLVFGCGADSRLWALLNAGGLTRFIESDPGYVRRSREQGLDVREFQFPTRCGQPAPESLKQLPKFIEQTRWDMIFIDGPSGYAFHQPGRELPICWASQLANGPLVVLHDFARIWERVCAERYLGLPDFCVAGSGSRPQEMAFWMRDRISLSALL